MNFVAKNRVCKSTDYGGFTGTVLSPTECAMACLEKYPETRFVEYRPKSTTSSSSGCDCDSSERGECILSTKSEWTVYTIIRMQKK